MIVTIDGPAGAGKSTVARTLAKRLQFDFLDTGAMYRAITLAALRGNVRPDESDRLTALLQASLIVVEDGHAMLNGEDVSAAIRTAEVTENVRFFAECAAVREKLTQCQRAFAMGRDLVTEGRDQGTVVFPDAECKFFVTASEEERARRRQLDFARQGREVSLEQVLAEQQSRDLRDSQRALAPLKPAADAVIVDTSELETAAVTDLLERQVREKMKLMAG